MSAASNYLEDNLINLVLRGQSFAPPTGIYISLHTGNSGETGANEVTTTVWPSYERMDSTQGDTLPNSWSAPSGGNGQSKNQKQILFPVYNGSGAIMITHFGLWDAQTGGNILIASSLDISRTVQPGDVFVIDVEKLVVTVA